ncbi:MAG: hypothetical protein A2Y76_01645 [Planctomycetes bacterium RBG_13_60_9]|nr:MAG: hypothetical protein A2Y76_01645 [Planctomycetes bacterium RBG_13_60_9]
MDWTITTAPVHEPVSLEQAKRHLRIDDTESDSVLRSLIGAARRWCEAFCGRAFLWQVVGARMDDFVDTFTVPVGPLIAVSSYTYVDTAGATQTLATTVYDADTTHAPGRVVLAYNQTWPSHRGHHHDVRVTYYAGHAAAFTRNGNTLVLTSHLLNVNDYVQVYNIGGGLPAGLSANTQYYVKAVTGGTVTLALTEAGEQITMTTAGTGTHYIDALPQNLRDGVIMKLTELYHNRGDVESTPGRAIRDLLGIDRMVSL